MIFPVLLFIVFLYPAQTTSANVEIRTLAVNLNFCLNIWGWCRIVDLAWSFKLLMKHRRSRYVCRWSGVYKRAKYKKNGNTGGRVIETLNIDGERCLFAVSPRPTFSRTICMTDKHFDRLQTAWPNTPSSLRKTFFLSINNNIIIEYYNLNCLLTLLKPFAV